MAIDKWDPYENEIQIDLDDTESFKRLYNVEVIDLDHAGESFAAGVRRSLTIIVGVVMLGLAFGWCSAANASGPQCFQPCPHKHRLNCTEVAECLPSPRPCLDVDIAYFACDRKLAVIDMTYPRAAFLCATQNGETRKVRRHKLVNATDAVIEAYDMNLTVCP